MKIFKLENKFFNFREQLKNWLEDIIIQIELKQLEFIFQMDPQIPQIIESDQYKLKNVLLNLMGNAIKYTDNGFIKLEITY